MSTFVEDKDRNIIPRWRSFRTTVALGELDPAGSNTIADNLDGDYLSDKLRDWQANRNIWFAADLISAAFVLGQYEAAVEAAEFVLSNRSIASEKSKAFKKAFFPSLVSTK